MIDLIARRRAMMGGKDNAQVYELRPEGTDNGRMTPIKVDVTTGQTVTFEFWADGGSYHGSAYLYDSRQSGIQSIATPIYCTAASLGASGQDNYWADRGKDATRIVTINSDGLLTIGGHYSSSSDDDKFYGKYIKATII